MQHTCFELDTVNIDWMICINFCLILKEGDWNGAGCHTNFSITPMRIEGGYDCIIKVCEAFGKKAAEHIQERERGSHFNILLETYLTRARR